MQAQLASDLELGDVLSATLVHHGYNQEAVIDAGGGGLLAALPSLSASRLQSDQRLGTDETELSLNLPFKSSRRHDLDDDLVGLQQSLQQIQQRYRAWFFSGLIRDAVWEHRLATLQLEQSRARAELLLELEQRAALQADAGAIPGYAALLLTQERLDAELAVADGVARERAAQASFSALTGLPALPARIVETSSQPVEPDYGQHPQLALLELGRDQQQALIALNDPAAADWNLALTARSLDGPGPAEKQYGVAVDIPLTFFEVGNRATQSQRAALSRDFTLQQDTLRTGIRQQWITLSTEAQRLRERRDLLLESARVGERIEAQLLALRSGSEVEVELVIRRLLEVLKRRSEAALIDAEIHRNAARLRQTAGFAL
ncbi:MAG: hypothetical protein RJQ10_08010 [Haliea sp.]|uniref:hypothetical protein n=1 Tax=Haliea sp. TaxID=1932666 RepID=UPI0032EC6229